MKNWIYISGPLAVVLALGATMPTSVEAQQSATKVGGAAPVASLVAPPVNALVATPGAASNAAAGAGANTAPLFIWDAQNASGAQVGAWGNGAATSTPGRNGNTLTATIRNFEEGIRFDLKNPVDLAPFRRAGWWRLRVQLGAAQNGGGRGRGQGGGNQTPTAALGGAAAPLTQLRLKLVMDNGAMSGLIAVAQPDGNRRRGNEAQSLLLAVRNMSATRGASGLVRRIILTGDSTASLGIEQVALVTETNRISATVRRSSDAVGTDLKDITLKPGRSATLVADVDGGTSDLSVMWNFNADNSPAFPLPLAGPGNAGPNFAARGAGNRGAQPGTPGAPARRVDAMGTSARPNWPNEEMDYRVEVTILDRAGKKPAIKKSFLVKIRG